MSGKLMDVMSELRIIGNCETSSQSRLKMGKNPAIQDS